MLDVTVAAEHPFGDSNRQYFGGCAYTMGDPDCFELVRARRGQGASERRADGSYRDDTVILTRLHRYINSVWFGTFLPSSAITTQLLSSKLRR
jgi:hypothetical protein